MKVACIIIACAKRQDLIRKEVLPSVLGAGFDEVIVSGVYHAGDGYKYLHIPPLTDSTLDALVKRDAGALATHCESLFYMADDHRYLSGLERVKADAITTWDVQVPQRVSVHPDHGLIRINNGESEGYCGGHGGLYRRRVVMDRPWSAQPHHRLWDVLASKAQQAAGFKYFYNSPLVIEDLETENCPWQ